MADTSSAEEKKTNGATSETFDFQGSYQTNDVTFSTSSPTDTSFTPPTFLSSVADTGSLATLPSVLNSSVVIQVNNFDKNNEYYTSTIVERKALLESGLSIRRVIFDSSLYQNNKNSFLSSVANFVFQKSEFPLENDLSLNGSVFSANNSYEIALPFESGNDYKQKYTELGDIKFETNVVAKYAKIDQQWNNSGDILFKISKNYKFEMQDREYQFKDFLDEIILPTYKLMCSKFSKYTIDRIQIFHQKMGDNEVLDLFLKNDNFLKHV